MVITPELTREQITIEEHDGTAVAAEHLTTIADLYADIFKHGPWYFEWHKYTNTPTDPRSANSFVSTLVSYGATLFLAREKETGRVLGCLIILRLTEESLSTGILADLREHGNAQVGEVYFAVFGVHTDVQRMGLGEEFMRRGLSWGGDSVRYWLRTQEGAKGMVRLSENVAGMRIHTTREVEQGGSKYVRRYYVRDARA